MRHIFTLLICFCIANTIYAQLVDSIQTYYWNFWNGNYYYYANTDIRKYNSDCKLDSDLTVTYNSGQTEYLQLLTFTYNGNREQEIQQARNSSNLVNQYRFTFIYNSNNKTDSVLTEMWDNYSSTWQNQSLNIDSYDADNFLVGVLTQYWNSPGWTNAYNVIYTNNSDGNAVQTLTLNYKTASNQWDTLGRNIFTYTVFKKIATDTSETLNKNNWQRGNLSIYNYDSYQRFIGQIEQYWDVSNFKWVNQNQDFITLNTDNTIRKIINQNWQDSVWVNSAKSLYSYRPGCALPVNLISFTAQKQNNTSLLQWQTTNQINNDYFDIERSPDSKLFYSIGTKQGLNNSGTNYYSFIDNAPIKGINYYRLKQVDRDGKFDYSQIASVDFINDKTAFAVSPNPANNFINAIIPQNNSVSEILIYDVNGKKLLHEQIAANITSKQINISTLTAGVYNIVLIQNSKKQIIKLIKK